MRDLVASESDAEVEDGFARLGEMLEQEAAAAEKAEGERLKRQGTTRTARAGAAQEAVDDWNTSIAAARAARG